MKKMLALLILIVLIFSSCSLNSDSKLYTAKGDAAFEQKDYETALIHYRDAAASGKSTDKVKALTAILDAYIRAKDAVKENDFEHAAEIIDDLEYDYETFSTINEDMLVLVSEISEVKENHDFVEKTLKALIVAIDDKNFEKAYEYIAEIEWYDFTDEQREEFDFQCYRLERLSTKVETPEPTPEVKPETKPETPPAPENEEPVKYYRVRLSWDDPKSQLGAFTKYDGAVREADAHPGYKVFDENGNHFWRDGYYLGKIGTNSYVNDSTIKGIVFDLEYKAGYMTWAVKETSTASTYTMMWTYANKTTGNLTGGRLHAGCDIDMHNYRLRNVQFEGGGLTGTLNFVQVLSVNSNGTVTGWANGCQMQFQNGILIRGAWNG